MNGNLKKMANVLAQGAQSAVASSVAGLEKYAKESIARKNYLEAQRKMAMRQAQIAAEKNALKPEHEAFGNALGACIDAEAPACGIKRPRRIEDIMCDDDNNNIHINGAAAPDFIYEAKRDYSNSTFSDVVNGRSRAVPTVEIEKTLNRSLRKYSTRRGYTFSKVTVDDIPHGKVRITVYNVGLTPEEQLRRNGYYGY